MLKLMQVLVRNSLEIGWDLGSNPGGAIRIFMTFMGYQNACESLFLSEKL